MKNIKKWSVVLLLATLAVGSCKKDTRELNQNLTPVGALGMPADQYALTLAPASNSSVDFRWDTGRSEDGDNLLYELAFDKEGGDFSKPVFKVLSDGGGVQNSITVTHKDLNKIANMAGIAASSSGNLIWTVLASKGTNRLPGSIVRTLKISRPAGFAEVPAELYLSGSATEGGTDAAKAVKLKKNEEGIFEVYTSLKTGDYILTDKPGPDGKKYYVENGLIKEGSNPLKVDGQKTYRLTFDFNVATATAVEIESVGLWMSAYNTEIGQLSYQGNSTWAAAAIPVEFFQFSWGRDERYKFVLHTSNGLQFMGSSRTDNGSPVGQAASYFYLLPVSNDQWANTYKFDPAADRKTVQVNLYFKADVPYTHLITVK